MSSFIVTTTAELNAALASAQGGDTIELAAGTYSGVSISNVKFGADVTVTSQDRLDPAEITDLAMAYDQGLVFQNLEFNFPLGDGTPVPHGIFVNHSSDIHFRSDSIHGVLNIAPTYEQTGIGFANSTNVSLENSELQYLYVGLTMGNDSGVLVSGNNFHDIRIDGIDGTAIQNGTVTNNNFSNFHHMGTVGQGGDHSDAIQFWTTGQTVGSDNLTVSNNVIVEGQGAQMQGIFLQDSVGNLPYENVKVTGNLVVGGDPNAIMVDDGHGALISNNNVYGLSDQTNQPWIKVQDSNQVYLTHNGAPDFQLGDGNTNLGVSGDRILTPPATDQGQSEISIWLLGHANHVVTLGPITAAELIWDTGYPSPL
jgi:hypothetical protein